MKYLIILITFFITTITYSQEIRYDGICISAFKGNSSDKILNFNNDDLEITLTPSLFWKIKIKNTSNSNIKIKWSEAYFIIANNTQEIIFDNDNMISLKNKKEDQILASNTFISKEIFPKDTYINGGVSVITGVIYKTGAPFIISIPYSLNNENKFLEMKMNAIVCKKRKN